MRQQVLNSRRDVWGVGISEVVLVALCCKFYVVGYMSKISVNFCDVISNKPIAPRRLSMSLSLMSVRDSRISVNAEIFSRLSVSAFSANKVFVSANRVFVSANRVFVSALSSSFLALSSCTSAQRCCALRVTDWAAPMELLRRARTEKNGRNRSCERRDLMV
ncbi:hypothetical protein BJ742DRAFT_293548 [Cladochytrium replicatum]|nr:hypothetical protein BJ742DRAFT_293548 [Cladochytrium replicatum]